MLPPAPPRFSTTTVRPSRSPRPLPTKRASVSATPPGANATMKVMSRAGYGCALAACTPSAPPSAAKAMTTCLKTRQFGIAIPPSRPIVLSAGGGADGRRLLQQYLPEAGIPTNLSGIREHPILGDDGITFDAMRTGQQDFVPAEARPDQDLDLPAVQNCLLYTSDA